MNVSPRTILELVVGITLAGLLAWQTITAANLRTRLAQTETRLKSRDLVIQAKDATATSCAAALETVQSASEALGQATTVAQAQATEALRAASVSDQQDSQLIDQLLRQRPTEGRDCEEAAGLARGAWEDGQ